MKANKIKDFLKRLPKKAYVIFIILSIIIIYVLNFLISIHFQLSAYLLGDYKPIQDFKKYKSQFEIIVKGVQDFKNQNPDFFDKYTGTCDFEYATGSLVFVKKQEVFAEENYYLENGNKIENYTKAFPEEFNYCLIHIEEYSNYVFLTQMSEF